jgi:hypothetical protein
LGSSLQYLGRVAVLTSYCCLISIAAFGQENTGSLNSVWEEDAKTLAPVPQATDLSTVAPLCTVDDFKNSALIVSGGWPQVGPFKQQDGGGNEFTDAHNDKLKIQVVENQVAQARLNVSKEKPEPKDLLDIQLDTDFLLESLGAKASSIAQCNRLINKEQAQIWTKTRPLQIAAGHYLVSIKKQAAGQDQPVGYSIEINNQDANSWVLKERSTPASLATSELPDATIAAVQPHPEKTAAAEPTNSKESESANKSSTKVSKPDPLKESFAESIHNWQNIKKKAVKQKQSTQLSSALGGRALAKQVDAVKWLAANQKSCDLTAKLISIDHYTQVIPAKKYIVQAVVEEQSKYIDDKSGQIFKEEDSTYKVSYTMEKIKDQWLITDYSVTSSSGTSSDSSHAHASARTR